MLKTITITTLALGLTSGVAAAAMMPAARPPRPSAPPPPPRPCR
ncbi:hypothetical protein [Methylobrevis pamukkalensis]|nr:hypothetical protein [Methylobrevis pamukkalensis]